MEIGELFRFDDPENHCFGCSPHNPSGLQLAFTRTGDRTVECRTTVKPDFGGQPGVIHGGVQAALPDKPIAILEAGWATTAIEFGERAGEAQQTRYYTELEQWGRDNNVSVFFFEAFDEPWKGNPSQPLGAEKHWGLWFVDRTPKQVVEVLRPDTP